MQAPTLQIFDVSTYEQNPLFQRYQAIDRQGSAALSKQIEDFNNSRQQMIAVMQRVSTMKPVEVYVCRRTAEISDSCRSRHESLCEAFDSEAAAKAWQPTEEDVRNCKDIYIPDGMKVEILKRVEIQKNTFYQAASGQFFRVAHLENSFKLFEATVTHLETQIKY